MDDQEADRVRIRRFLRKAGLEFQDHEAHDLASFRSALDQHQMDIVFIDYHLDMENGLDALRHLIAHEDQADALPIMVSSVDRHDIIIEAMRMGCADYIVKEEMSVDAVRKSVASAFERKILIAAISESQSSRHAIRMAVQRFSRTSAPELRRVLSATMRHARTVRSSKDESMTAKTTMAGLEASCRDVFGFLDELKGLLDTDEEQRTGEISSASV
ncbi:MAG: response regulator [Pseudomonadota bacterium]